MNFTIYLSKVLANVKRKAEQKLPKLISIPVCLLGIQEYVTGPYSLIDKQKMFKL